MPVGATITRPRFAGPDADKLDKFAQLMERLWNEHRTAFVQAGDERIYCFGGNDHIVIVAEELFGNLVEVQTPLGNVSMRPGEDGVVNAVLDEPDKAKASLGEIIERTIQVLERYYYSPYGAKVVRY